MYSNSSCLETSLVVSLHLSRVFSRLTLPWGELSGWQQPKKSSALASAIICLSKVTKLVKKPQTSSLRGSATGMSLKTSCKYLPCAYLPTREPSWCEEHVWQQGESAPGVPELLWSSLGCWSHPSMGTGRETQGQAEQLRSIAGQKMLP